MFCLVDLARGRVLRTVENPTLLVAVARSDGETLTVELPGGTATGIPEPTGDLRIVDYWGRDAKVELIKMFRGLSSMLKANISTADALLYYAQGLPDPSLQTALYNIRELVYGGSVPLVTPCSMALLSERLGRPVGSERFRATYLLDIPGLEPHGEDAWVGRAVMLGEATVRVRGVVPRCAVVDLDPATGVRDVPVLGTLAGYRRSDGEICFGVDAEITVPGRVSAGDPVVLGRD